MIRENQYDPDGGSTSDYICARPPEKIVAEQIVAPASIMISLIEAFDFESDTLKRRPALLLLGVVLTTLGVIAFIYLVISSIEFSTSNETPDESQRGLVGIATYLLSIAGPVLIMWNCPERSYRKWSIGVKLIAPYAQVVMQGVVLFANLAIVGIFYFVLQDKESKYLGPEGYLFVLVPLIASSVLGYLGASSSISSGSMSIAKEFKYRNFAIVIGAVGLLPPLLLPVILGITDKTVWPGVAITSTVAWLGYLAFMRRWIDSSFHELLTWFLTIRNAAFASLNEESRTVKYYELLDALSLFHSWMLRGPGALHGRTSSSGLIGLCQVTEARRFGITDCSGFIKGANRERSASAILRMSDCEISDGMAVLFESLLRSTESSFCRGETLGISNSSRSEDRANGERISNLRRLSQYVDLSSVRKPFGRGQGWESNHEGNYRMG